MSDSPSGFDGAWGLRAFSVRLAGIRSDLQQSLSGEDKEVMVSDLKVAAQWKSPDELPSSQTSQHQLQTDKRCSGAEQDSSTPQMRRPD
ncbi:hypothetical protein MAP00_004303 [Monascus purpureus]|nr:hypothetical protein MAP00_004303 [Monascus purpureus]